MKPQLVRVSPVGLRKLYDVEGQWRLESLCRAGLAGSAHELFSVGLVAVREDKFSLGDVPLVVRQLVTEVLQVDSIGEPYISFTFAFDNGTPSVILTYRLTAIASELLLLPGLLYVVYVLHAPLAVL